MHAAAVAGGSAPATLALLEPLLLKAAALDPDVYFERPQSNASVSSSEAPAVIALPAAAPAAPSPRAITLRNVHRYGLTLIHTLREVAAAELDWALAVLGRLSGGVLAALDRTEGLLGAEGIVSSAAAASCVPVAPPAPPPPAGRLPARAHPRAHRLAP